MRVKLKIGKMIRCLSENHTAKKQKKSGSSARTEIPAATKLFSAFNGIKLPLFYVPPAFSKGNCLKSI